MIKAFNGARVQSSRGFYSWNGQCGVWICSIDRECLWETLDVGL